MDCHDISKYGVPREYTACPGCGQQYGHHNTKICITCEECSKCCRCDGKEKEHLSLKEGIEIMLERM
jgi:hypothetical protein